MTRAALERALAAIREAPRGQRHDTLVREAARMFAVCDDDQIEAALLEAARQASEPSEWRDREQAIRDERAFIREANDSATCATRAQPVQRGR